MPRRPPWFWLLLLAASALAVGGWLLFWYQCDDAYIAFRYISNRRAGWGYVWNPPPFTPVEGYTSFLWIVLLDGLWSLTGLDPTVTATWVDLGFSLLRLGLVAEAVRRLPLPEAHEGLRPGLVGLSLLGCVTNTTWLAWTSSGLETSMYDALLIGWVFWAVFGSRGAAWPVVGTLLVSLITLTRPDGLLFLVATPVIVAAERLRSGWRRTDALALLPFALPVAHLLWRHATYGFWLPNTYYAKHVRPWPEAGFTYLAVFLLEYTWWIWLVVLGVLGWRHREDARRLEAWWAHAPTWLALGALVAHAAYYVVRVGGDHFEYRIWLHWVEVAWVIWPWAVVRVAASRRAVLALSATALVGTWWITWPDWIQMRQVETKQRIPKLQLDVAPLFPPPLSWYASLHDLAERWLCRHTTRISHQSHRMFRLHHQKNFPEREASLSVAGPELWTEEAELTRRYPVIALGSVGIASWNMPYVAILDRMGLNDRVIARNPVPEDQFRWMAHDRRPPPGYIACYRPNIRWGPGRFEVKPRTEPLSADDIRACEEAWMKMALDGTLPPGKG
ncbi:MAG: hypothetical protein H6732_18195 [Alphaproteobacteria bacterium]|nr:hypothetical protein [Alphaproteobacteria bacterium]